MAIFVAMIVSAKLSPKTKEGAPVTATVEILVAARDLSVGDTLKEKDVRWDSLPEASVYKGVIKRKDQADEKKLAVYDQPLRRNIAKGEAITTQSLIADMKGSGSFLSAMLEPNMRAVAISVKAESSAGGFVAPADYVDVILTHNVNLKGEAENYSTNFVQRYASETIISNVKVLAVDQNSKDDSHEAKVARTVTVAVTKEQAQKLALATSMGSLTLSLRRLGEKDTKDDINAPLTTDVTSSQVIRDIYDTMDKSKTASGSVRLYNGSDVQNVPVRTTGKP